MDGNPSRICASLKVAHNSENDEVDDGAFTEEDDLKELPTFVSEETPRSLEGESEEEKTQRQRRLVKEIVINYSCLRCLFLLGSLVRRQQHQN